MLQEASTHLIAPEPSEDLITNEPWTIETYADGLMDDLFADIDDILDGSGNLPHQTVRTEPVSQQTVTVTVPQIVVPQTVNRPQALPPIKNKQVSALVVKPATVTAIQKHQESRGTLNKLLLLGVILSVAAGIIYLLKSGILTIFIPPTLPTPQPQSQLPTKKTPETDLVDYMSDAIAVIDQREMNNNQIAAKPRLSSSANLNQTALALPSVQPVGTLPPPLTANNTLPATNRATNVVERIYIPVYQAPSPMRYALPPISTRVQIPPPVGVKNAPNPVRPQAKPVDKMVAATVRTAPIPVRPAISPLPGLPSVPPKRTAAKAPAPVTVAKAPTPRAELEKEPTTTQQQVFLPSNPTELEGLLELGNKSAALFKIEGVTRLVNVGESIGSSGWTLVEVSNGEAIVRRNGEVRSIYTGQKF
ncbi:hypothetical protein NIES4074_03570 [Cylindrospermum sp. NIES-4074]|nr:hypothetical protein NIES4074_03570 [Cylindrospermum sp. NIES-4074]